MREEVPLWIAAGAGGAGLCVAAVTVPGVESALLVPALFVLAGLLGPIWRAAPLTCRLLVALGSAHLLAFGAAALAHRSGGAAQAGWHVLAQILFVGGFALLVVLAAAYPSGPIRRWTWATLLACVVPLLAALSGPTPAVLGEGSFGPIAAVLPAGLARASGAVLALPLLAAGIGLVRFLRDGREMRGRLTLPLAALVVVALLLALGAVMPSGFATALFLLGAPLLPVALVAGSRPVLVPPEGSAETVAAPPGGPAVAADGPAPSAARTPARTAVEIANGAEPSRLDRLSPREREVLALMAEGRGNAEIGRMLHISVSAVEKHSTAIFT